MSLRIPALAALLLFAAPAVAHAAGERGAGAPPAWSPTEGGTPTEGGSSCDDDGSGFHDVVADLKQDLFFIGGHVLQTVSPMAMYPKTPDAFAKEEKRIAAEVAKRMAHASARDQSVVSDLRSTGVSDVDLFHGSHVILGGDGGAMYDRWRAEGARPRVSSHYPGVPVQQYEIVTPVGVLLFGKTAANGGDTWFQLEKHPDGPDRWNWFLHRVDYVRHKGFGDQNVGPMGMSPYTDKRGNPVVVDRN